MPAGLQGPQKARGLMLSEQGQGGSGGGSGDDVREAAGPSPSPAPPTPHLVALFRKAQSLTFCLADSPEGRSAPAPFGLASKGRGLPADWSSRSGTTSPWLEPRHCHSPCLRLPFTQQGQCPMSKAGMSYSTWSA